MNESFPSSRDCSLFTLNIEDKIYRCPVSVEALYMLCRDQDSSLDQVDAYLRLKQKIQHVIEKKISEGSAEPPPILLPGDFFSDLENGCRL